MPRTSAILEVPSQVALVANEIQELILRERKPLPKELNGSPMRPSDPRAVVTRKHMQQGLCTPVRHLLTVSACDVRDGVSVESATQPYRQMIAYLELCAKTARPRDLGQLWDAETKAQCRLDIAQRRAHEQPDEPSVLREAIAASIEYESAQAALRRHYEARLMIAAGSTRRPMEVAR